MKRLIDYLRGQRKTSAAIAKERLQIIIAHERGQEQQQEPEYLHALQQELIAVIAKYVKIDQSQVKVGLERSGDSTVLEVNIPIPEPAALV